MFKSLIRKTVCPVLVALLFLSSAPVMALPESVTNKTSSETNGLILISVLKDGLWVDAGNLPFDKFFNTRSMDLTGLAEPGENVTVKLIKSGGGAAHLDKVSLEGRGLLKVTANQNIPDEKLTTQDFDVVPVDESGMIFEFGPGQDKILDVVARIEPVNISKRSFQIPLSNSGKSAAGLFNFLKYDKGSNAGTYNVGDMDILAKSGRPFFSQFVTPASGHPAGTIYGWVANDDKNLYVALDFTPDNTMDGDKDYAKVFIRTSEGVRTFKVSTNENTWGKPFFIYTDKVKYQHKFYEFVIPLELIGATQQDSGLGIDISFALYGTASEESGADIAYDPSTGKQLITYEYSGKIKGQLINQGEALSSFDISGYYGQNARVAYDDVNHRFMVVWEQDDGNIYGQILDSDGNYFYPPESGGAIISDAPGYKETPVIAFDRQNQRYLISWSNNFGDGGPYAIQGQMVNADGSLYGAASDTNFTVSSSVYYQGEPAVAVDAANHRFMVVWSQFLSDNSIDINLYGAIVSGSGDLAGSSFPVYESSNQQVRPALAFDRANLRFLVTWEDYEYETLGNAIYARLMDSDGNASAAMMGDEFIEIAPLYGEFGPNHNLFPKVAFDSDSEQFMLVWEGDLQTYVSVLNGDGLVESPYYPYILSWEDNYKRGPAITANQGNLSFSVAYQQSPYPIIIASEVVQTNKQYALTALLPLTFESIRGDNESPNLITTQLTLPDTVGDGLSVSWTSSHPEVVTEDGIITRPSTAAGDQQVTLSVTLDIDGVITTKEFGLTVKALTGGPLFIDPQLAEAVAKEAGKTLAALTEADIGKIKKLNVAELGISDLTGLQRAVSLERLYLHNNEISDISALEKLTSLKELSLSNNQISDVAPLAGMVNLEYLYLDRNDLYDINDLLELTGLKILNLSDNDIYDLVPLRGMSLLQELYLDNNSIGDPESLSGLTKLTVLSLNGTMIQDLGPLQNLIKLKTLNLASNALGSNFHPAGGLPEIIIIGNGNDGLKPIKNLSQIERLNLSGNFLPDISDLSGILGLKELFLDHNEISDLVPLGALSNLTTLTLQDNQIADIHSLAGLTHLNSLFLQDNLIEDIVPLLTNADTGGLGSGDHVYLWGNYTDPESLQELAGFGVEVVRTQEI